MNQDSSFPPMLPPSTELGALLFAVLPCLQETYRPLASFAYHMTELTRLKNIPSIPPLTGISGIDALITDKDIMLRSLSFYGRIFRMPLLSTIATLLQGMQFYQTYKDILPGLFSGLGGSGGASGSGNSSPDLFSMLGGLSPDLLTSMFSGFSGGFAPRNNTPSSSATDLSDTSIQTSDSNTATSDSADPTQPSDGLFDESVPAPDAPPPETGSAESSTPTPPTEPSAPDDTLYDTLYSFLTPEQQKIYEQLMHTD